MILGDLLQFERRGYFRIDDIRNNPETNRKTYVLVFIPDGKTQGLASIATKVHPTKVNHFYFT